MGDIGPDDGKAVRCCERTERVIVSQMQSVHPRVLNHDKGKNTLFG